MYLIESQKTFPFSSRPWPMYYVLYCQSPQAVCRVKTLIVYVNDNDDAEILCLQEDLKVLKVQGVKKTNV